MVLKFVVFSFKNHLFRRWFYFLLAAVVGLIFVWYGIVYLHWTGWPVRLLTRWVSFPAILVNGEAIKYDELIERMDRLSFLSLKQSEGTRLPDKETLLETARAALIFEEAVEQIAGRDDVRVSKQELVEARRELQGEADDAAFEMKIEKELDVSSDIFMTDILAPFLLAKKLESVIAAASFYQSPVRAMAEQARERLLSGDSFDRLFQAAKNSSFTVEGGDYGYISAEKLPEGWEALLTVSEDEVGPLIETERDFVVILVLDIIGKGEESQRHTQAMLFKKITLYEVVEDFLVQSTVRDVIKSL